MSTSLRGFSDNLFAPASTRDVLDRLARIEASDCPCDESPHLNALYDLAYDDVPILLLAIEAQAAEIKRLRG